MRYKIKDIPSEGLVVDQALSVELLTEALDGMDADLERSAAAVRLDVSKVQDDVFVRGSVKATIGVPCSACLKPARAEVDVPVKMIFRLDEGAPDVEDDDPLEDTDFGVHDGKWLELAPMIRELLILSVPMSPRCREDCKGLCVVCGQDRNLNDCGHRAPELEVEPDNKKNPFAALKGLKL